jgi:hypothetical protein
MLVKFGTGILVLLMIMAVIDALIHSKLTLSYQGPRLCALLLLAIAALLKFRMTQREYSVRRRRVWEGVVVSLCLAAGLTWMFLRFPSGLGSIVEVERAIVASVTKLKSAGAADLSAISAAHLKTRFALGALPEVRWWLGRTHSRAVEDYERRVVAEIGRDLARAAPDGLAVGELEQHARRIRQLENLRPGSSTDLKSQLRAAIAPALDRVGRAFDAMVPGDLERFRGLSEEVSALQALDYEAPMADLKGAQARALSRSGEALAIQLDRVKAADLKGFLQERANRQAWAGYGPPVSGTLGLAEKRWLERAIDDLINQSSRGVTLDAAIDLARDADRLIAAFFPEIPWNKLNNPGVTDLRLPAESYQARVDALDKAVHDRLSATMKAQPPAGDLDPAADPLAEVTKLQALRAKIEDLEKHESFGSTRGVKWRGTRDVVRNAEAPLRGRRVNAFNRAIALTAIQVRSAISSDHFVEARRLIDRVSNGLKSEWSDLDDLFEFFLISSPDVSPGREKASDQTSAPLAKVLLERRLKAARAKSIAIRSKLTERYADLDRMRLTVAYVEALKARAAAAERQ